MAYADTVVNTKPPETCDNTEHLKRLVMNACNQD